MLTEAKIQQLKESLHGPVILPNDNNYDEVRALYNGMIDKRPALIARCRDTTDVIAAVNFGRDNDLLIAVRGGGHNGPGLGSCDDGMMIDLSLMRSVHVNPETSLVRAEPGCTNADLDHATHPFGLAVPAGLVASTGIAGLTLGGGHGYLTRQYGLTIDNLVEADVVLADGSLITTTETSHPDLFWALRGGGGNFGIVTSFLYQAQPVRNVFAGPIFYDLSHTREIMQWYRDWLPTASEKLCTFLGLKTVPSSEPFPQELWGRKICALISSFNGSEEEAAEALQSIHADLPAPLMNGMMTMPFPVLQGLFDPLLPKGMQWYWKGDFVRELPDEAIDVHINFAENLPNDQCLMHLYPIDGAVQRVASDATAWNCRDATWSMVIAGIDHNPANAETLIEWGRSYWNALHPYNLGGGYVNFMMEEGDDRIRASYGINYQRLTEIKALYDPENLFRVNQNIKPATVAVQ